MRKFFCLLTACLFLLSGCKNIGKTEGVTVITTIYPPYDFVRQIAGDNVTVKMLINPGSEVHSFEPSPKDIMEISECDLFIYTGGENDEWVDGVLESAENVRTLKMVDCVELIEDGHHHHEGEEHSEPDDHVWTSPVNAIKICENICDALCLADPDNEEVYRKNTAAYKKELQALDNEIREVVSNAPRKEVVFADRFAVRYFTEEYGLDYISAFPGCTGEAEANPQTVAELIEKVRAEKIPVVFYAELSNTDMADTISEATGAKKRLFHSCHNLSKEDFEAGRSYIDITKSNISVLREALY